MHPIGAEDFVLAMYNYEAELWHAPPRSEPHPLTYFSGIVLS